MQKSLFFVGVDVGGTNIKGGVLDDEGRPLSSVSLETEAARGQEHGLNRMAETVRQAVAAAKLTVGDIAAIGIATPGTMDIPGGLILDPPNLKPWRNVPVRQFIADTFRKPTAFQNDANAAACGEYWSGAGHGMRSMVLFTLGTGIGGGIVVGDFVVEGAHSHGAEVGHMKIQMTEPRLCGCGKRGCLEAYASATAVVKRTRERGTGHGEESSLHAKGQWKGLTARDVSTARRGPAQRIVEETAFYLAIGGQPYASSS